MKTTYEKVTDFLASLAMLTVGFAIGVISLSSQKACLPDYQIYLIFSPFIVTYLTVLVFNFMELYEIKQKISSKKYH